RQARARLQLGRVGLPGHSDLRSLSASELQQDVSRSRSAGALRRQKADADDHRLSAPPFSHPADTRSDTITIQQLLDHMGGYDDRPVNQGGSGFDPTYAMRKIALDEGLAHPAAKLDIARYMYGRPLDFTPGAKSQYSNYGYLLASTVVEKVTGIPFFDYIKAALLQPAGITD